MTLALRYRTALLHFAFWGVYGSFYLYQLSQAYDWRQVLPGLLVTIGLNAALAYYHYCWLLPRLLRTRQVGAYLLRFAVPYAAVVALRIVADQHLARPVLSQPYLHSAGHAWSVALGTLFMTTFIAALYFTTHWFALEARARTLENEKLATELHYLKAQLNPHFLFNTLNNLYYLAYSRSAQTPEVVATLAQMMRYMLEEATRPRVPLDHELDYLRSYMQLERLRLNHPVPLTLTVVGDTAGQAVAPLLFLAFLENAFKHGVSTTSASAWVRVHVALTGPDCLFTVSNQKLPPPVPASDRAGMGLPNVRRRLALLYPNRHTLTIDDQPDEYHIQLRLTL